MPRISIHAPDTLMRELNARGTVGEAARDALERYYAILAEARAGLRGRFSTEELAAICEVSEGQTWDVQPREDPRNPQRLELMRRIGAGGYTAKIDRAALLEKLGQLTIAECAALIDAAERYWRAAGTGIRIDPAGILG
jgi:hypothetical protein